MTAPSEPRIPGVHGRVSQIDDLGLAMYCGFGRQPGQDGDETLREHARVIGSLS